MTNPAKLVYHVNFMGILFLSFLALQLFLYYVYQNEFNSKNLQLIISYLNIGQGDAILIETPKKHTMLIDSGPVGGPILSQLGQSLPFYRRVIDILMETHPDSDHIGGFADVMKNYHTKLFFEPGLRSMTDTDMYVHTLSDQMGILHLKARKGMTIVLDKQHNIYFQILFPDRDVSTWQNATNDGSIVGKLTFGTSTFLFTGDSPSTIEDYLIRTLGSTTLASTVLKVGHHGSKYSTSNEYVQAVHPTYGVISVGVQNRYGHPNQQALDNLTSNNVQVLRTDQLGRIVFHADGNNLWYTTSK